MNKFKIILYLWGFINLVTITGCGKNDNHKQQKYMFAVYYENIAWLPQQKGLVVDQEGNLSLFDYTPSSGQKLESLAGLKTESELSDMFEKNYTWQEKIDSDTLNYYGDRIINVIQGNLEESQSVCADAGRYEYVVFNFDESTGIYEGILCYQAGDWMIENNAEAAAAIKAWLIKLALKYEVAFTFGGVCTGI